MPLAQTTALVDDTYRMLCGREVAERMDVSDWVIKGIRRAGEFHGDSPFIGRYTRMVWIDAWLRRHPEFVASHFVSRNPTESGSKKTKSGVKPNISKEGKTPRKAAKQAA